jgi:hypothetical protein
LALAELEARLARLEVEVEALKRQRSADSTDKQPTWEQISSTFKYCPEIEEAMRLGREWRASQCMDYTADDTDLMGDTDGSA